MAMTPASMQQKIEAALISSGYTPTYDIPAGVILALCTGIINEIVANSELVPVTTDSGIAGSGIITGKVR